VCDHQAEAKGEDKKEEEKDDKEEKDECVVCTKCEKEDDKCDECKELCDDGKCAHYLLRIGHKWGHFAHFG
jgi:hypothetical protein